MKRFIAIILAVVAGFLTAAAQTPVNAVIEKYDVRFTMDSQVSGTCEISIRTSVLKAKGSDSGIFALYTDSFHELTAFSGEIYSHGKLVKKLKIRDLTKISASSGIADDTFLYAYDPGVAAPYTAEYRYKITYRHGIATFPTFLPIVRPDVVLISGNYSISVPARTVVKYSSNMAPKHYSINNRDIWSWSIHDHKGYSDESFMPDIRELVPYVYACPADFSLNGKNGRQSDWKELGTWLYGLQKDTQTLPETFRASLLKMTSDTQSEFEKIKIIYEYLRKTTRYVSIQLGLGGLKPSPAADVLKTGFGDCKGLSNYMQAMLGAVGIKSEYLIVNTDEKLLLPDYASLGQMNHAMLCVPMDRDSLWIECTNPTYPLGYRHDGIAGHEVVLITPEGGKKVTVKGYDDNFKIDCESMYVTLSADGSAVCKATRTLRADLIERYLDFAGQKPDNKRKILTSRYNCLCNNACEEKISDNFNTFFVDDNVPEISVTFRMDVPSYAKVSKDRLFVPLNHSGIKMFHTKNERINEIVIEESSTITDTIRIAVPTGFEVEHIPENMQISSDFGQFNSESGLQGSEIHIVQSLTIRKGRYPKESYQEYRAFAKSVSKAYDSKLVLIRRNE